MTPNSIYTDASIHGGIQVSSPDIIKMFADVDTILKVSRSNIRLQREAGKKNPKKEIHHFTLTDPDLILRFNGTAVRVRAISTNLNVIYLFHVDSDVFIGQVRKTIAVYGDIESIRTEPAHEQSKHVHAIMNNGNQKSRIQTELEKRLETIEEYEPAIVSNSITLNTIE